VVVVVVVVVVASAAAVVSSAGEGMRRNNQLQQKAATLTYLCCRRSRSRKGSAAPSTRISLRLGPLLNDDSKTARVRLASFLRPRTPMVAPAECGNLKCPRKFTYVYVCLQRTSLRAILVQSQRTKTSGKPPVVAAIILQYSIHE
jgi:hypothetical protein